jgi:hypothetical protein
MNEQNLAQANQERSKYESDLLKIQKDLTTEMKEIHIAAQQKEMAESKLGENKLQTSQLKENIKVLEDKVQSAEQHAKNLEEGFKNKLVEAKKEQQTLQEKINKMGKEETQKELETNALIKQTLMDLKKYQNMDQMKEEEAAEIRNQTVLLK